MNACFPSVKQGWLNRRNIALVFILCLSIAAAATFLLTLSSRWHCGAPPSHRSMLAMKRSSCLEAQSELIYQDVQARQDREIASLADADYTRSEALYWKNTRATTKYIWDYFLPTNACPLKEKLGSEPGVGDNGKWICGIDALLQKRPCIVYSFGSNGETAFEEDILARAPHCDLHIFDPTLSAVALAKVEALEGVTFHSYGLGGRNQNVRVDRSRVMGRAGVHAMELRTLDSIMADLGHSWVDIFKVDIEGAEWGMLQGLLASNAPLPFTQMQVEYHVMPPDRVNKGGDSLTPRAMLHIMRALQDRGLRVFHSEPNYWWTNSGHSCVEFAYVQVDRQGHIVTSLLEATASMSPSRSKPAFRQ